MSKGSKGFRRETRSKLKADVRAKFKPEHYLKKFKKDEKVLIMLDPSSQKGMPFPKFKGKIGVVEGKRGNSYIIKIKDKNKEKTVIASPEHLKLTK
ncbi:MAG: 50S ribosomal protein L21e [Candidatus Aenigmarchaeota archaeon]|nr:50S ribosomal protein L21e [Candidatus Aenigmarchaeota archaeon]